MATPAKPSSLVVLKVYVHRAGLDTRIWTPALSLSVVKERKINAHRNDEKKEKEKKKKKREKKKEKGRAVLWTGKG